MVRSRPHASFVDALSFALVKLDRIHHAFTFDADFRTAGFATIPWPPKPSPPPPPPPRSASRVAAPRRRCASTPGARLAAHRLDLAIIEVLFVVPLIALDRFLEGEGARRGPTRGRRKDA